jgi:hypothetical protein
VNVHNLKRSNLYSTAASIFLGFTNDLINLFFNLLITPASVDSERYFELKSLDIRCDILRELLDPLDLHRNLLILELLDRHLYHARLIHLELYPASRSADDRLESWVRVEDRHERSGAIDGLLDQRSEQVAPRVLAVGHEGRQHQGVHHRFLHLERLSEDFLQSVHV